MMQASRSRAILKQGATILSMPVLLLMTLNAVLADWNLSSVWGFLLSTTYGPLFPGVHAFSVASVVVATYWVVWATKSLPMGVLVGGATVAVHELTWAGLGLLSNIHNVITPFYALVYIAILAVALAVVHKKHKALILWVAAVSVSYYVILLVAGVIPYSNPALDGIAVMGWVLPSSVWVFA
jgi:hypothetical protein